MRTGPLCIKALCVLSAWLGVVARAQAPPPYPGAAPYELQPRTALVIGVPTVQPGKGFAPLNNPRKDAAAVASRLRELAFTVFSPDEDLAEDAQLTRQAIKQQIYDFAKVLKANKGVGVVYFSGHGLIDNDGRAYLVPYDASVSFLRDLSEELLPVSLFYDAFDYAGNVLNVLIIDACRDTAFPSLLSFGRSSFSAGEPEVEVVYRVNATQTGHTADDGDSQALLGPYATAFIEALDVADADLSQVFDHVNDRLAERGMAQLPVNKRVGSRDFIFRPTVASFNRERTVFAAGGARSVYENLYKQFAGGYFGNAALAYAKVAPLPPPVITSAEAAVTTVAQRVEPAPTAFSKPFATVVPGGTVFRVMGGATVADGREWLPVTGDKGLRGYIDKEKTSPAQLRQTPALLMSFEPGTEPGVEQLSADALTAIRDQFDAQPLSRIIRARIIVRRPEREDGQALTSQALVARQAIVAKALAERGLDINQVERVFETASPGETTALRLTLTIEEGQH